jgi:hypothetical protein
MDQLALFNILGAPDKELTAHAGPHASPRAVARPVAIGRWRDSIASHLAPAD